MPSRGRMITMGTITLAGAFIAVLAASGPHADPRIRMGAAVGIIVTAIIGTGLIVGRTASRSFHKDIEDMRRDQHEEIREVADLQLRIIARETYEMRRQLADWPALTDDTGPQPIHNR